MQCIPGNYFKSAKTVSASANFYTWVAQCGVLAKFSVFWVKKQIYHFAFVEPAA